MATHIGKGNTRDDAAWTHGEVVHVATGVTNAEGPGVTQALKAGKSATLDVAWLLAHVSAHFKR